MCAVLNLTNWDTLQNRQSIELTDGTQVYIYKVQQWQHACYFAPQVYLIRDNIIILMGIFAENSVCEISHCMYSMSYMYIWNASTYTYFEKLQWQDG